MPIKRQTVKKDNLSQKKNLIILLILFLYFCLGLLSIVNHEPWRDELQTWLVAKESKTIGELFHNIRYEGHPSLWFLILFGISKISDRFFFVQILHLSIATCAVSAFLFFAPFTKLQKVLFVFSYFLFFEFCVISRNYILGITLLFFYCVVYQKIPRNIILLSIILFFVCQTSVSGLIIAICLEAITSIELVFQKSREKRRARQKINIFIHFVIFFLGIAIFFLTILPPKDFSFGGDWNFSLEAKRAAKTLTMIWKVFFPFPKLSLHFWNTNVLDFFFVGKLIEIIFSLLIFGFIIFLFLRRPILLFFFLSATLGILAFSYFRYLGFLRHFGHVFIVFIITFWLKNSFNPIEVRSNILEKLAILCEARASTIILFVLIIQFASGLFSVGMDWIKPFSASKEASEFIKKEGLDKLLIIGSKDYAVSPVAFYINKNIFYPTSESYGSFVKWTKRRKHKSCDEIARISWQLLTKNRKNILIILNYDCPFENKKIRKIAEFKKSIVTDEIYNLLLDVN